MGYKRRKRTKKEEKSNRRKTRVNKRTGRREGKEEERRENPKIKISKNPVKGPELNHLSKGEREIKREIVSSGERKLRS